MKQTEAAKEEETFTESKLEEGIPEAGKPETEKPVGGEPRADKRQKDKARSSRGGIFRRHWLVTAACLSLIAAVIFTAMYGVFEQQAKANTDNPLESQNSMTYLYQNSYVLYRDLYNRQNQTDVSYHALYLQAEPGYEILTEEDFLQNAMEGDYIYDALPEDIAENAERNIEQVVQAASFLDAHLREVEGAFGQLNSMFDYLIEDVKTGAFYSNLPSTDIDVDSQFFYVQFLFDEFGNVTVGGTVQGEDANRIRKNANETVRNCDLNNLIAENIAGWNASPYVRVQMPKNCCVTFCISNEAWQQFSSSGNYYQYEDTAFLYSNGASVNITYLQDRSLFQAYSRSSCGGMYFVLLFAVMALAFLLPARLVGEPWKKSRLFDPWLEVLAVLGFLLYAFVSGVVSMVSWVCGGTAVASLCQSIPADAAYILVYLANFVFLFLLFFCAAYVGICARAVRGMGLRNYLKKRWFFYQIFPYLKKKTIEFYNVLAHFDVTRNAKKLIFKIVLVNAVILFCIGSLWMGGFPIAVVYSVLLYFVLKKYISDLQKKYGILLRATNEIAQGNLNVTINEDLGVFEPFKPQVIRIQDGFKKAVEEEVKSQRMRSELITNVSHDLKTPLTAIITYIKLLQDENITEEQRREYLNTLERKSLRLKVLIEDLFEVSKATSQNITLNIMDVDILNLIKQVELEMSDKLTEAHLEMRMSLPEEKYILPLDSQKTYRIYENLFGNIAKYALPGTRVYVSARILEEDAAGGSAGRRGIEITLKNITAQELTVTPEELTERFVRGDASRNTEGSGLGLAIAKSFTELQGGQFRIQVDGDLFKVVTVWRKPE